MRTTLKHTKTNTITRNQLEQVFACSACGQLHGHKIVDKHGRIQFDATPEEGTACTCGRIITGTTETKSFI